MWIYGQHLKKAVTPTLKETALFTARLIRNASKYIPIFNCYIKSFSAKMNSIRLRLSSKIKFYISLILPKSNSGKDLYKIANMYIFLYRVV